MKRTLFHSALKILLTLFLASKGLALHAGIPIPDPNFRQFLLDSLPLYMNADQTLNQTAAQTKTSSFHCYGHNVSDLTGIQYFTNISTLEVKYNPNLHSLPDISALTQITILGLDSNGLTVLPDLSSFTQLDILSFHHNQVAVIPSLANLTNLTMLLANNNQLTSLPDLSAQSQLIKLICSDNPLTSLPSFDALVNLNLFLCQRTSISSIPDLSQCTSLEYLICTNNLVTVLPDLSQCPLKELKVFGCKLTSLPDLSSFSNLYVIHASNNELSFEDILPTASHPAFTTPGFLLYSGEKPGNAYTMNVTQHTAVELNLGFDHAVSGNTYAWYKDDVFLTNTSVNKLTFPSVAFENDGVYTCKITNSTPGLTGFTLTSKAITLRVSPCILANDLQYTIDNTTCSYPVEVSLDESSFTSGTTPFTYKVADAVDTLAFVGNVFSLSKEGIYNLIVTDANGCEVTFESKLVIERHNDCDPVFYPDGDGIADTYFIENKGWAKIYNRSGEMIKELQVPGSWDGNDKRGQQAPSGVYVIVVNKDKTIKVTLLR